MAGIAVTVKIEGAPQSGTKTIECSSPANIAAITWANNGFTATTAAGAMGDSDPGGATVFFPAYNIVLIRNT